MFSWQFKGWSLAAAVVITVLAGMLFSVSEEVIASQGQESESLKKAEEGLIGYWSLDEKTGSAVSDISGYSNDGIITAVGDGTSVWIEGRYGQALQFSGVDSSNGVYVNCGNSNILIPTTAITIMAWIKVQPAEGGCILRKRSGVSGYIFETYGGKIRLVLDAGWVTNKDLVGNTNVTTGTWIHVAGTYDGTTLKVYVNGVLDGSSIYEGSITPDPDNFYIGYRPSADFDYFRGSIDEVKVYSRALSVSEIESHYNMSAKEVEKIKESLSSAIEYRQSLKAEKLVTWLESGEGKTLIVSPSFLFPPVLANGKPIYESREERNEYYLTLGIWKNTELKEYQIKEISSADRKLSLIKPGMMNLKALLPAQDIENKLPEDSRILLKGRTKEGKEVPLMFEIVKGKNRIINIAFLLKPNFEIEKSVTMSVLNHIKATGGITPDIICSAETGYGLHENELWESSGTIDDMSSITKRLDMGARSKGKGTLPSILFWCSFLKNNKPTFVGISLVDEPIHTIGFMLCGKQFNVDIIKPGAMGIVSIDSSIMCATYYCEREGIIFASTDEVTQWLIETLDGEDSAHTNLFRLYTESKVKVFFLRPFFWAEEDLIQAFKIEEDRLEPVPITVDKNILILKSTGGVYLVYYGSIKERELSKFREEFILSLKDKKEIRIGDKISYSQYEGDFNVHWIEL